MDQSKDSVRMRMRTISGGKQSLYLDIYVNGKREYEFLKLYIYKNFVQVGEDVKEMIQEILKYKVK